MNFHSIPSGSYERYKRSIPVPIHIKTYVSRKFFFWAEHSGYEWTVSRYKDLKACIIKTYATGERVIPQWFKTTAAGNLKGPFGSLFQFALDGIDNLKATMYLLNMVTSVSRKSVSQDLFADISSTIMREQAKGVQEWLETSRSKIINSVKAANLYGKIGSKEPVGLALVAPGKLGHQEKVAEDVSDILGHPLWETHKDLLEKAIGVRGLENTEKYPKFPLVGNIHVTHEPGLKTRYFAAPNQVLQRALEPLKTSLMDVLKQLPWDCTHNHRKADMAIQDCLLRGHTVDSIDMSKATDNFPWSFQKTVLQLVVNDSDERARRASKLFADIIEMGIWEFHTEEDYQPSRLWWNRGQPLGLGPSFPMFALTHGLLLFMLNNNKHEDRFYVLGDDVVILDSVLAERYKRVLETFDVPVSEMKTLSSSCLAQFGGVTLNSDTVFWQPKWCQMTSENMLDVAAWWYSGVAPSKFSALIKQILAFTNYSLENEENGGNEHIDAFLFEALYEVQDAKLEKSIPTQTIPSYDRIFMGQISKQRTLLPDLIKHQFELGPYGIHPDLMDGTQTAHYPAIRRRPGNRDPYSIGTDRKSVV